MTSIDIPTLTNPCGRLHESCLPLGIRISIDSKTFIHEPAAIAHTNLVRPQNRRGLGGGLSLIQRNFLQENLEGKKRVKPSTAQAERHNRVGSAQQQTSEQPSHGKLHFQTYKINNSCTLDWTYFGQRFVLTLEYDESTPRATHKFCIWQATSRPTAIQILSAQSHSFGPCGPFGCGLVGR